MIDDHKQFIEHALEHILQDRDPAVNRWYTDDELAANLRSSFAGDLVRVDDDDMARRFAGGCPVDGAEASDYKNVFAPFSAGTVLLGARFKGLDLAKPFVDVVATSAPLLESELVEELCDLAYQTYSIFEPKEVRFKLLSPREMEAFEQIGYWEKKYLVGSSAEMAALPEPRNLERVELRRAVNLDFFDRYTDLYAALLSRNPQHAEYATAGDREEFEFYLSKGTIFEIFVDQRWAGVVAGYRDVDSYLEGFCIEENFLADEFRSRGFGCAVQRRLVEVLEPGIGLLFGTIHQKNLGAYHAALRSGRVDIGGYYWVPVRRGHGER